MSRTNLLALAAVCAALIAMPTDVLARGGRRGCGGGGGCGGCGGYVGGCGGCGGYYGGCGGCGMTMGCGGCGGCGGGIVMPYAGAYHGGILTQPWTGDTGGKKKGDTGGKKKKGGTDDIPNEISLPVEASIVVNLPANARLTIDGQATTSTGSLRVFRTPALEQGHSYTYTLRAEIEREGRTETVSHQVVVRPGEQTRLDIAIPAEGVASR